MKKGKLSLVERKSIRTMLLFVIIQCLIIISFVRLVNASQQLDINDTKHIDITVDDIYIVRVPNENWLVIVADSAYYLFTSRATFKDYSVHELYDSISVGDQLSLIYCEADSILFKKVNNVVDARTEGEIYRSLDEFNKGKQGLPLAVVILFSLIEAFFCGIVILYVLLNKNTMKGFYKKIRNRVKRHNFVR